MDCHGIKRDFNQLDSLRMETHKKQTFVSEPLKPVTHSADTVAMAAGGPGLPHEFVWRGGTLRIAAVVRSWRETGPCKHGSSERYVRKHWFEVKTASNRTAKIYFERQSRGGKQDQRWWLFSMENETHPNGFEG
jgi:hypothetical protein